MGVWFGLLTRGDVPFLAGVVVVPGPVFLFGVVTGVPLGIGAILTRFGVVPPLLPLSSPSLISLLSPLSLSRPDGRFTRPFLDLGCAVGRR